jgi:hypothetical protein
MASSKDSGKETRRTITIDPRFVGPPNMTQGGYISGVLAEHLDSETVEVTMRSPTPMGKPLTLDTSSPDRVLLYDGERLLDEARPGELQLEIPKPISLEQARKASLRHVVEMPYPDCFGCGSGRSQDNGLHLRAGPVEGRELVAIDWVPRAAAVGAEIGAPVPRPIVWASMECPIARAMELGEMKKPEELIVLGRMVTRVRELPKVGNTCFFMGWPMGRDGRKIHLGGTLHRGDGEVLVETRLTFVTLKEGVTYDSFR